MILICLGTRPEFIKIKPIIKEFIKQKIPFKTLFTGQHEDLLSEIKFDFSLKIFNSGNRLNSIFTSVILGMDTILEGLLPEYVLVQGDTTSAAAAALAAYNHKIKIIHLEAGLRTYDLENPYPEELNRQMIARMAKIHLCPTNANAKNLKSESVGGKIFVVGNTALDNLVGLKNSEIKKENKILITLHRRENHDIISDWFNRIESLAINNPYIDFIIPIHPNPAIKNHSYLLDKVKIIDAIGHDELIELLARCQMVITDSGGIQEEASFLKIKTIICRRTTERMESIGQSGVLCKKPEDLQEIFNNFLLEKDPSSRCPYGYGNSSKKIIKILESIKNG